MKVKDIVSIMNPWQDLIVRREHDTQIDEPLFNRDAMNIGEMPSDECMNLNVTGIDAFWGTIVLYTA